MTSPLLLPRQVHTAAGWALAEYRAVTLTSGPAVAGVATAYGDQLDAAVLWLVDHMVCSTTSTTATRLRLYDTTAGPGFLLDGSDSGNFDVADWPAGLQLQPSRQLVAQWTGASDGAVGTCTLQLRVLRQR